MAISLYFDMKFSHLDYRIHLITRAGVGDGVKHDLCGELLSSRPCDIGIFLRHFRKSFPDREAILSDLALQTLVMREKTKLFSKIASERGHARERKNLNANTGPGTNFLHHRRLDLLSCVRTRLDNAGGLDPMGKRLPQAEKQDGCAGDRGRSVRRQDARAPLAATHRPIQDAPDLGICRGGRELAIAGAASGGPGVCT